MEGNIQKVLDTRGALRCVRFESGNVGVVNTYMFDSDCKATNHK